MSTSNNDDLIRPDTPPVDPQVASIAHRLAQLRDKPDADDQDNKSDDDNLSDELDALEEELGVTGYREQRLEELRQEMMKIRDQRENDHGQYIEIFDEKEVIRVSANEKRCVIHFYHRNFQRCKIIDKHLEELAPKYFSTRFIRVFVENVPWLVEKLGIKVLPCVICFIDGVTKDRLIGFEEIGNTDDFNTVALEMRLAQSGVLQKPQPAHVQRDYEGGGPRKSKIRSTSRDCDDDFDL